LELAYGGPTSRAFSSCHKYDARLLTPPRQSTHKMRFSTHPSSFGERPPPFNRFCTTSQPSSASPTNTPLYAPQTIASFSLPVLQVGLGHVYTLARSQPTAARAPSRDRVSCLHQTYMRVSSHRASSSASQTYSRKAGLLIKIRRLFATVLYMEVRIVGKGRGWGVVRVLVEGEGDGSSLGCVVSSTRRFRKIASPRWVRDVHGTRTLLAWHTWRQRAPIVLSILGTIDGSGLWAWR